MQFPMFERLKQGIREYRDRGGKTRGTIVESGVITAVSAGSAGAVAAVVTTPVDVLKTRIMLSAAEGAEGDKASRTAAQSGKNGLVNALGESVKRSRNSQKSTWLIAQEIVQEQGYKGLWRGGALRAVWTFVGAGLYLGAYESGRVYLAARRGERVDEGELF